MAEKFSVTGDQHATIGRRIVDMQRQLYCSGGLPLDPEKVARGLQEIGEGGSFFPDTKNLRQLQAFRLFDNYGIGEALGFASFEDYLDTIPGVPGPLPECVATNFGSLRAPHLPRPPRARATRNLPPDCHGGTR